MNNTTRHKNCELGARRRGSRAYCRSVLRLVSGICATLIMHFACAATALAQGTGAWGSAPSSTSSRNDDAIQAYRFESNDKSRFDTSIPRGLYHMPQGQVDLWPECEVAIDKLREPLGLKAGIPAVVVVSETGPRGYYTDGVITVRKDADCSVLVHELVHHTQFMRLGTATTAQEWHRREEEAKRIEYIFRDAQ